MLYILSASYDSVLNAVKLELYNDKTEEMEEWTDADFKAYFLSKRDPAPLVSRWKTIVKKELIKKYDALNDKEVEMWKVSVNNPLAVKKSQEIEQTYENYIKFFQCYIYDKDIKMGMPYRRENDKNDKLVFQYDQDAQQRIQEILNLDSFKNLTSEEREVFEKWAMLLEYPAPNFKRASLDIEVFNEGENQIPNAEAALLPVLSICLASNRGEKIAFILVQADKPITDFPENITKVVIFNDEKLMLEQLFEAIETYPLIITFNGDDFDLKYLYYRALRLGVPHQKIPIIVKPKICILRKSIHIDLYKFFSIKAMKIYAFGDKYKDVDLDSVARALIKRGKIEGEERWIVKMSYHDLIRYCMNDAEITLELTTYNNDLVMNLIIVLERMSRMPIINVSRKSVSSWIKSFMLYEHRQRNILIPIPEEIKTIKGQTVSEAIIKGKKYKGAIVYDPIAGTHFLVKVLDFASLYPSIIKVYNIGYSTINCPHPECKTNTIGELPHWMCTKNRSLESLLIGSLRDLRVFWYKKQAKNSSLDKVLKDWYGVAEQSIKVIMNASYGVFGAESFVLYCPPVAEEVTAIARHVIGKTTEHAQEIGLNVLYGDTDSIFIKDPPEDKLRELIDWTYKKYGIEFEVDKIYRYVCLSIRKKNYFGVKIDGEVDVKGLTGKKKHTPPIIKTAFNDTKKILSEVKTPEELEIGKKEIMDLVKRVYFIFKNRSWENVSDLAFSVTMNSALEDYKKTMPQHVKAAKLLIERGYQIGAGSVIRFVKTDKRLAGGTNVKPVETVKKHEVDVRKYIEFLKSTFEQVLDPMNINFEQDILGVTRLDQWSHK